MVLDKLSVPGRPTIWMTVGQGPSALAVGTGGGCLDIFTLIYPFSSLSPSLWEMARYRLKYCLKGPLNPKPTNQPTNPTILRHEFISITTENTYQIVFVSLMYFSFSYLLIRRFDRQEKPFLTGPPLHVWGTFGSEGDENF